MLLCDRKIAALVYYVRDLDRVRNFMLGKLDFAEIGESSPELTERGHQKSAVFQAGDVNLVMCAPHGEGGRAWRYLRKHPEGVGTVVFDVENIEQMVDGGWTRPFEYWDKGMMATIGRCAAVADAGWMKFTPIISARLEA